MKKQLLSAIIIIIVIRWEAESLSIASCFAWLKGWATCPTYTIAGMYEMYEQLLPTLYPKEKTQTSTDGEVLCRLCGKVAESVAHVVAGCSSWHKSTTYRSIMQLWRFCFLSSCEGMGFQKRFHHGTHRWCQTQPIRTPRVRRFGIFPSLQSATNLEQIGSTRDLSATRGKKSAHLKWAAHGLRVEPRKMTTRHSSMVPWCGSWSRD